MGSDTAPIWSKRRGAWPTAVPGRGGPEPGGAVLTHHATDSGERAREPNGCASPRVGSACQRRKESEREEQVV
jgi:hypothetical protein